MKKSVVVLPPDPKIRRAIANSTKAFKQYAQEQARKLNPVSSKTEVAQFKKLQVAGKDLAVSAKKARLKRPKLPKFPRKPYFTFPPPSPTFPSTWTSLEIRKPPYNNDYQIGVPIDFPTDFPNDPRDGICYVDGTSASSEWAGTYPGNIDTRSGLVIWVTSDQDALVFVQPQINYHWERKAFAPNGCGSSAGGLEVIAWRNLAQIMPPQRVQLFSWQACFGMGEGGDGAAGSLTIPISFQMKAGEVVVVDCGCWLHCDHSGMALGSGFISVKVGEVDITRVMNR